MHRKKHVFFATVNHGSRVASESNQIGVPCDAFPINSKDVGDASNNYCLACHTARDLKQGHLHLWDNEAEVPHLLLRCLHFCLYSSIIISSRDRLRRNSQEASQFFNLLSNCQASRQYQQ